MNDIRKAQMLGKSTNGSVVHRPLSPHLGIYGWPPTMVASILNRATGIALSVGALLLVWWLVALASGPAAYADMEGFIRSPLGLLMLLGWTASLLYHLFGGLRHLAWDMGYLFAKPSLNPVTYLILALTAGATALVWLAAYLQIEG
jgi:succinate dehydrogenase / fumarate reductase cytochrome b subunit